MMQPVQPIGLEHLGRAAGIEIRQRGSSDDLAGRDVEQNAERSRRAVAAHRSGKLGLHTVLDAEIDGAHDRKAHHLAADHRTDAVRQIDVPLQAGDPLVVDVDAAEYVRGKSPGRVDSLGLWPQRQPRQTQVVDTLRLRR